MERGWGMRGGGYEDVGAGSNFLYNFSHKK